MPEGANHIDEAGSERRTPFGLVINSEVDSQIVSVLHIHKYHITHAQKRNIDPGMYVYFQINTNKKWRKGASFLPNTPETTEVSFHVSRQESGRERK